MNDRSRIRILAVALVASAAIATRPAIAVAQGSLQSDLVNDVAGVEKKYVALAEAMPASTYAWRPMEGVRSVGEVYCHVAGANYMIPGFFGVESPAEAARLEEGCAADDPESLKAGTIAALQASFAHAREAIASVSDADLDEATRLFGRDTTNRAAMLLYVTHMHEHLGQSVAYARSNGVTPPWSAGG